MYSFTVDDKNGINKLIRKAGLVFLYVLIVVLFNVQLSICVVCDVQWCQMSFHSHFTAVLTKPDLIDKGTEKNILDIVRNKVIPLHKGYIMVKCRGQQQIDENIPLEEATEMERDFFQKHDHFRLQSNFLI